MKKPLKTNKVLQSKSYRQKKEFDQVLNDSLLIENKMVDQSINQMA